MAAAAAEGPSSPPPAKARKVEESNSEEVGPALEDETVFLEGLLDNLLEQSDTVEGGYCDDAGGAIVESTVNRIHRRLDALRRRRGDPVPSVEDRVMRAVTGLTRSNYAEAGNFALRIDANESETEKALERLFKEGKIKREKAGGAFLYGVGDWC